MRWNGMGWGGRLLAGWFARRWWHGLRGMEDEIKTGLVSFDDECILIFGGQMAEWMTLEGNENVYWMSVFGTFSNTKSSMVHLFCELCFLAVV